MNRSRIIIGTGLVTLLGGLVADRVVTGLVMANAYGTGLSPAVEPASSLDGFATSIPFAGEPQ